MGTRFALLVVWLLEAMAYNGLVQSWPEITRLAREKPSATKPGTDDLFD